MVEDGADSEELDMLAGGLWRRRMQPRPWRNAHLRLFAARGEGSGALACGWREARMHAIHYCRHRSTRTARRWQSFGRALDGRSMRRTSTLPRELAPFPR